jgi:hypothetical protein
MAVLYAEFFEHLDSAQALVEENIVLAKRDVALRAERLGKNKAKKARQRRTRRRRRRRSSRLETRSLAPQEGYQTVVEGGKSYAPRAGQQRHQGRRDGG